MPRDLLRARVELGCAGCELLLPPRQSLLGCRELGRAFLEPRPVVRSLGDLRLDRREPVALGTEQAKPAAKAALAELELAPLSVGSRSRTAITAARSRRLCFSSSSS